MDFYKLRNAAADSLAQASYDPKKLAAVHTGAAALVSLILTVLNYLLSQSIDNTGGLANMGSRAVLGTVQSVLSLAGMLALPFWEVGFLAAALRMARTRDARPSHLLEGFRRWGAVARLYVLQFSLFMLAALACSQVASILFSFSPFMDSAIKSLQKVMEQATAAGQTSLGIGDLLTAAPALIPMYVMFGILFALVAIPLFYRLRMAQFAVMDDAPGARKALAVSSRLMRGKRLQLFRLDLRFWWYYGAQLLIAAIAYVDVILPKLGITLPISADTVYFASYGIHLALQLLLAWQFGSLVHTTYAHCYDHLKQTAPVPPEPKPTPQELPWEPQ